MGRIRNLAAVKTAADMLDTDVFAGDPAAGSTFKATLAELKDFIPGASFESLTNNVGNTTLTLPARKHTHRAEIAVGGVGSTTRIVIVPTANRNAGDRCIVGLDLPATAEITIEFRNGTSVGALLGSAIITSGSAERARCEFVFTGAAWKKDAVIWPA